VAGRIDDIDAGVLPHQRGDLGQDGDAALALEIVGIERPLGDALILAKRARLLQQPVDQRGLAVVDVGNDGNVAQRCSWGRRVKSLRAPRGPRAGRNIVSRRRIAMRQNCVA
jgi:hypothetical protein